MVRYVLSYNPRQTMLKKYFFDNDEVTIALYSFIFQFEHSAWRAMLIKDNSGDWGLCVAAWKGVTPGIPGRPGNTD